MRINYKLIPYLLVNIAAFYFLPTVISDTGSAMAVMLIGIPAICFATAIVFGARHSFQWLYPVIVAVLFVPTVFIFYNSTAWVYSIAYGVIAAIGSFIGKLCFKPSK